MSDARRALPLVIVLVGCRSGATDAASDAGPSRDAALAVTFVAPSPSPPPSAAPAAVPTTWCLAREGTGVGDRLVPPFTMSAAEAMRLTVASRHIHALYKQYPNLRIDQDEIACARVCTPSSFRCGFHLPLKETPGSAAPKLVEWVYVDPIERKLWFPDGDAGADAWTSETLAAP